MKIFKFTFYITKRISFYKKYILRNKKEYYSNLQAKIMNQKKKTVFVQKFSLACANIQYSQHVFMPLVISVNSYESK